MLTKKRMSYWLAEGGMSAEVLCDNNTKIEDCVLEDPKKTTILLCMAACTPLLHHASAETVTSHYIQIGRSIYTC